MARRETRRGNNGEEDELTYFQEFQEILEQILVGILVGLVIREAIYLYIYLFNASGTYALALPLRYGRHEARELTGEGVHDLRNAP